MPFLFLAKTKIAIFVLFGRFEFELSAHERRRRLFGIWPNQTKPKIVGNVSNALVRRTARAEAKLCRSLEHNVGPTALRKQCEKRIFVIPLQIVLLENTLSGAAERYFHTRAWPSLMWSFDPFRNGVSLVLVCNQNNNNFDGKGTPSPVHYTMAFAGHLKQSLLPNEVSYRLATGLAFVNDTRCSTHAMRLATASHHDRHAVFIHSSRVSTSYRCPSKGKRWGKSSRMANERAQKCLENIHHSDEQSRFSTRSANAIDHS